VTSWAIKSNQEYKKFSSESFTNYNREKQDNEKLKKQNEKLVEAINLVKV